MSNVRFIELSHPIEDRMTTYEGLPAAVVEDVIPRLDPEDSHGRYGGVPVAVQFSAVRLVGNTGTHVDAPHFYFADVEAEATIRCAPLDKEPPPPGYPQPEYTEIEIGDWDGRPVPVEGHGDLDDMYELARGSNFGFSEVESLVLEYDCGDTDVPVVAFRFDEALGRTRASCVPYVALIAPVLPEGEDDDPTCPR